MRKRMRGAILLLVGLVAGALAGPARAVTLVGENGQAVGGSFQRWADESRVPTIAGQLAFTTDPAVLPCQADGCRLRMAGVPPMVYVSPTATGPRDVLYFELGGIFDWLYLTARDRSYIVRHFHPTWPNADDYNAPARGVPWRDTLQAISRGGEDGYEGLFALVYADCAEGVNDAGAAVSPANPVGVDAPQVVPDRNLCHYIDRVARRVHADMASASLARWNRPRLIGQFRWLDPAYRQRQLRNR